MPRFIPSENDYQDLDSLIGRRFKVVEPYWRSKDRSCTITDVMQDVRGDHFVVVKWDDWPEARTPDCSFPSALLKNDYDSIVWLDSADGADYYRNHDWESAANKKRDELFRRMFGETPL